MILAAICLVALNDHVLKHSPWAGLVTGKISDFAGLFFFPFLLIDLASLMQRHWQLSTPLFAWSAVFTGLGFVALKCHDASLQFYRMIYAAFGFKVSVVQDPTDLLALIMLPLALRYYRQWRGRLHECP
jgi:hypothetical protein